MNVRFVEVTVVAVLLILVGFVSVMEEPLIEPRKPLQKGHEMDTRWEAGNTGELGYGPDILFEPPDSSTLDRLLSENPATHAWLTAQATDVLDDFGLDSYKDFLVTSGTSDFPRFTPLQLLLFGDWAGDNWCYWYFEPGCLIDIAGIHYESADHYVDLRYAEGVVDHVVLSADLGGAISEDIVESLASQVVENIVLEVGNSGGLIHASQIFAKGVQEGGTNYIFALIERGAVRTLTRGQVAAIATGFAAAIAGYVVETKTNEAFALVLGNAHLRAETFFMLAQEAWEDPLWDDWDGFIALSRNYLMYDSKALEDWLGSYGVDFNNKEWAMYYMGRALHYVQDASNPYHTIPWYEMFTDMAVFVAELAVSAVGCLATGPGWAVCLAVSATISALVAFWKWSEKVHVLSWDHPFFESTSDGRVRRFTTTPNNRPILPHRDENAIFSYFGESPRDVASVERPEFDPSFAVRSIALRAAELAHSEVSNSWVLFGLELGVDWVEAPSRLARATVRYELFGVLPVLTWDHIVREFEDEPEIPELNRTYTLRFTTEPKLVVAHGCQDILLFGSEIIYCLDTEVDGLDYVIVQEATSGKKYGIFYEQSSLIPLIRTNPYGEVPDLYEATLKVAKDYLSVGLQSSVSLLRKFYNSTYGATPYLPDSSIRIRNHSNATMEVYSPDKGHLGQSDPFGMEGGIFYTDDGVEIAYLGLLSEGVYYVRLTGIQTGMYGLEIEAFQGGSSVYYMDYYPVNISLGETHESYVTVSLVAGRLSVSSTRPSATTISVQLAAGICGPSIVETDEAVPVTLSSCSSVSDGEIVSYVWSFDGFVLSGQTITYTWYDNAEVVVTLTVTSVTYVEVTDPATGKNSTVMITKTESASVVVRVFNLDPEESRVVFGFTIADITFRAAGEKWHDAEFTLKADGKAVAIATVLRSPGSPDEQAFTIPEFVFDLSKVYTFEVTYDPTDDAVNGEFPGSTPVWVDLLFWDGNFERIHHNFNIEQSCIRETDRWIHVEPWKIDLSPYFVGKLLAFDVFTTDDGTDDLTITMKWGDNSSDEKTYFWDGSGPDGGPTPYDVHEGSWPMTVEDRFFHIYWYEDNFFVIMEVVDDDGGLDTFTYDIDAIHLPHILPTR